MIKTLDDLVSAISEGRHLRLERDGVIHAAYIATGVMWVVAQCEKTLADFDATYRGVYTIPLLSELTDLCEGPVTCVLCIAEE